MVQSLPLFKVLVGSILYSVVYWSVCKTADGTHSKRDLISIVAKLTRIIIVF